MTYTQIVRDLRAVRIEVNVSQNALSEGLPVRGKAISEWETMAIDPTLDHLFLWCRALDRQPTLVRPDGVAQIVPLKQLLCRAVGDLPAPTARGHAAPAKTGDGNVAGRIR